MQTVDKTRVLCITKLTDGTRAQFGYFEWETTAEGLAGLKPSYVAHSRISAGRQAVACSLWPITLIHFYILG